ncbi:MAG: adenylate kinase [Chloroflexi bacterium]|nr:adenylate kinase [Chloroflexota bacterium]|tara:strand:+ start:549 stop:1133 length:585 start_codon:yes stop_codon:yes gene_type:complete
MKSLDLLIFLGPPGSGKGTQAQILTKKLNYIHISIGDLLRENISNQTDLGKLASKYVSSGELVPDDLIIDLVNSSIVDLQSKESSSKGVILDGFPRTINQAAALENKIKELDVLIKSVVYLDISDEKILSRLLNRGRDDDEPELIKNRLDVYRNQTEPLLVFYDERKLLNSINGDQELDDVNNNIMNVLRAKVI